jgi:hypothetical protein
MISIYESEFPELFEFIRENKIAVTYHPEKRSFSIVAFDGLMRQPINFCPWTGRVLPPSLADEFANRLEALDLSALEPDTWPIDLRGEEWWIREGL